MEKAVMILNGTADGLARTIKAQRAHDTIANFARHDSFQSTAVIEIYEL